MRRRTFLSVLGATGMGAFAGCSALENESNTPSEQDDRLEQPDPPQNQPLIQPRPEVVERLSPTVRLDASTNPIPDGYRATIENTGNRGQVVVALFWQFAPSGTPLQTVDALPDSDVWEREGKRELFVGAGEQRVVEFTASEPQDAIDHQFHAEPAIHGGRILNRGGPGEVTVSLYEDALENTPLLIDEKTVFFESEATEQVTFDERTKLGGDWYLEFSVEE